MPFLHKQKHKCPCGKNYFIIKNFNYNKGHFEECWEMNCSQCKKTYRLSSFLKETQEGFSEVYLWSPINILSDLTITEAKMRKAQGDVVALAHERYLEQWVVYCCKGKTKRGVWGRMTSEGKKEPTFSLFEKIVTNLNMADYLINYFNFQNMGYIFRKLNICDPQIEEMVNLVERYKHRLIQAQNKVWQQRPQLSNPINKKVDE